MRTRFCLLFASASLAWSAVVDCNTLGTFADLLTQGSCKINTYGLDFVMKSPSFFASGPLTPSNINMSPISSATTVGLGFSGDFTSGPGLSFQYLIGYTIDPLPDVIQGWDLLADDNAFTGFGITAGGSWSLRQDLCVGPGCAESFILLIDNTSGTFMKSVAFSAPNKVVDVLTTIRVENGGGFSFFSSDAALVPEPGTWAMLAGGMGLLLLLRRR